MKQTTNLKLNKPERTDPADITQLNGNWDTLDSAMLNHGRHIPNTCTIISDWNTATKTGWYMGNDASNAPDYEGWCFGFVIAHTENYVYQEVYGFSQLHTRVIDVPKYIRDCHNGTWSDWVEVTVQRTVPKDAKLEHITSLRKDAQVQIDDKMQAMPTRIEFAPLADGGNGGYIDFHFNNDHSVDYTSRIIEGKKGILTFLCDNASFKNGITVHEGHTVFSTYNKPTGSYLGNNSYNSIQTGGTGSVLVVWKANDEFKAIITPNGGFAFGNRTETDAAWSSDEVKYADGTLVIGGSINDTITPNRVNAINKSGSRYYYQCL